MRIRELLKVESPPAAGMSLNFFGVTTVNIGEK